MEDLSKNICTVSLGECEKSVATGPSFVPVFAKKIIDQGNIHRFKRLALINNRGARYHRELANHMGLYSIWM